MCLSPPRLTSSRGRGRGRRHYAQVRSQAARLNDARQRWLKQRARTEEAQRLKELEQRPKWKELGSHDKAHYEQILPRLPPKQLMTAAAAAARFTSSSGGGSEEPAEAEAEAEQPRSGAGLTGLAPLVVTACPVPVRRLCSAVAGAPPRRQHLILLAPRLAEQ